MGSLHPHCMIKKHFALAVGVEEQDTLWCENVEEITYLVSFTQRRFNKVSPLDISRKKIIV